MVIKRSKLTWLAGNSPVFNEKIHLQNGWNLPLSSYFSVVLLNGMIPPRGDDSSLVLPIAYPPQLHHDAPGMMPL